ncbi:hypothetical protein H920_13905 [Fukomys damarensis]|uniref:DUF4614 domain-containing protein n=1 Tax=Fukomys damarensis TaxID=885580 RepID=A0A091D142_FUKDA|nr:hypothetical protein H920_13905 [Fukomys damarensis]
MTEETIGERLSGSALSYYPHDVPRLLPEAPLVPGAIRTQEDVVASSLARLPGQRLASVRKSSCGAFASSEPPWMEGMGDPILHRRPAQAAPTASRFIKRDQSRGVKLFSAPEPSGQGRGPWLSSGGSPATALATNTAMATGSRVRASAVLRKVAQMESKILSRAKACATQRDTESDPKKGEDVAHGGTNKPLSREVPGTFQTRAREASTAESPAPGAEGRRFLKTKGPAVGDRAPDTQRGTEGMPRVSRRGGPARKLNSRDSDEEEMQVLLGSLAEPSREASGQLGLPGSKVSQPGPTATPSTHAPRMVSLSTSGTSAESASCTAVPSPLACSPRRSAMGPDDSDGDSSLTAVSEKSDLERKGAGASGEKPSGSSLAAQAAAPAQLGGPGRPQPQSLASQSAATSGAGDEGVPTESEDTEGLGGSGSSGRPCSESAATSGAGDEGVPTESEDTEGLGGSGSSGRPCSEVSTVYSGDFERSPGASEDAPDGTLDTVSSRTGTVLLPRPPSSRRPQARPAARAMMKEMAVQTLDAFAGLWTEATGPGSALGGSYVDPAPIAPHVLGADAIEAAALDDLLRQQLHLTRQFIQASHHLHASLLQSLDRDTFHYHSLEEAKEVSGGVA